MDFFKVECKRKLIKFQKFASHFGYANLVLTAESIGTPNTSDTLREGNKQWHSPAWWLLPMPSKIIEILEMKKDSMIFKLLLEKFPLFTWVMCPALPPQIFSDWLIPSSSNSSQKPLAACRNNLPGKKWMELGCLWKAWKSPFIFEFCLIEISWIIVIWILIDCEIIYGANPNVALQNLGIPTFVDTIFGAKNFCGFDSWRVNEALGLGLKLLVLDIRVSEIAFQKSAPKS